MISELSKVELMGINGGQCGTHESSDQVVQGGYSIGCRIGRAIGASVKMFGEFAKALNPFSN